MASPRLGSLRCEEDLHHPQLQEEPGKGKENRHADLKKGCSLPDLHKGKRRRKPDCLKEVTRTLNECQTEPFLPQLSPTKSPMRKSARKRRSMILSPSRHSLLGKVSSLLSDHQTSAEKEAKRQQKEQRREEHRKKIEKENMYLTHVNRILNEFQIEILRCARDGMHHCDYSKNEGFFLNNYAGFPEDFRKDNMFVKEFLEVLIKKANQVFSGNASVSWTALRNVGMQAPTNMLKTLPSPRNLSALSFSPRGTTAKGPSLQTYPVGLESLPYFSARDLKLSVDISQTPIPEFSARLTWRLQRGNSCPASASSMLAAASQSLSSKLLSPKGRRSSRSKRKTKSQEAGSSSSTLHEKDPCDH